MPDCLELQDSTIMSVARDDGRLRIEIDGYVHRWRKVDDGWEGTGWSQPVTIDIVTNMPAPTITTSCGISDGRIVEAGREHDNLLPIPYRSAGPVSVYFTLVSGETAKLIGNDFAAEVSGEARFIEHLPDDFERPGQ